MNINSRLIAWKVVVVMIAILGLVVSSPANKVNARKGHGSCFQQAIADGKDQPFNRNTFSTCSSAYEIEIMKGYPSVEGNTTDTCNNAEYAGWVS